MIMTSLFECGMSALRKRKYEEAIEIFQMCIDLDPSDMEASSQLKIAVKRLYEESDQQIIEEKRLIEQLSLAINSSPNCFEVYYNRGKAHMKHNDYEMAILDFSKAIEIQPSATDVYLQRADLFISTNRLEEAVVDLDYYIENIKHVKDKDIIRAYKCRAQANYKLKKYKKVILDYDKILIHEKESNHLITRAIAKLALGIIHEATIDFKEALKIEPDNQEAIFLLDLIDDVKEIENIENERTLCDFTICIYDLFKELLKNEDSRYYIPEEDDYQNLFMETNECIRVYPNFFLGYTLRAYVYNERKDYYNLNLDTNLALSLKPDDKIALSLQNEIPWHLIRIENTPKLQHQLKKQSSFKRLYNRLVETDATKKQLQEIHIEGESNQLIEKPTIEWVEIPSGSFLMGSPESEKERGYEPQREVTISGFKMSKYAITFEQFDLFCDATLRLKPKDMDWGRGKRPVINVSWYDALEFAKWMGCRLPTSAEWEYACRAGTTTPFHTGENITTDEANYDGNYPYYNKIKGEFRNKTLPVGSFLPNAWGLYDMHGNVWEWCNDWCDNFYEDTTVNPQGPPNGELKEIRGGSFQNSAHSARSASSAGSEPKYRSESRGFRLVLIEKETL